MPTTVALTDVGLVRSANEDTVLTEQYDNVTLLVVADGMGGHAAGDTASEMAAKIIQKTVSEALDHGRNDCSEIIDEAVRVANETVHTEAMTDPAKSGMGTTVVAALVDGTEAVVANIGDSRAYHINDNIEQITVDQSLVRSMVEAGELTEEEAKDHPQSNVLNQSLGTSESVDPDFYNLHVDGRLLLCSDGLTDEVGDETIHDIVAEQDRLDTVAESLVDQANENGGSDNISVVLYEE